MTMVIELIVPGEPVGKGRPRISKWGGVFTPPKTRFYEAYIRELFVTKYPNFIPMESAISLRLGIYKQIPKSFSKKKRGQIAENRVNPIGRPDVDNYIKASLDALESLAFRNDSQIVNIQAIKKYSEQPRLEIYLEEIE